MRSTVNLSSKNSMAIGPSVLGDVENPSPTSMAAVTFINFLKPPLNLDDLCLNEIENVPEVMLKFIDKGRNY